MIVWINTIQKAGRELSVLKVSENTQSRTELPFPKSSLYMFSKSPIILPHADSKKQQLKTERCAFHWESKNKSGAGLCQALCTLQPRLCPEQMAGRRETGEKGRSKGDPACWSAVMYKFSCPHFDQSGMNPAPTPPCQGGGVPTPSWQTPPLESPLWITKCCGCRTPRHIVFVPTNQLTGHKRLTLSPSGLLLSHIRLPRTKTCLPWPHGFPSTLLLQSAPGCPPQEWPALRAASSLLRRSWYPFQWGF